MEIGKSDALTRSTPQDVMKYAHELAKVIARCTPELVVTLVDQLNADATNAQMIGQEAELTSDILMRFQQTFNNKTQQFDELPLLDMSTSNGFGGTFMGFETLLHEGRPVLAYLLAGDQIEDSDAYAVARAPVDAATIIVDVPKTTVDALADGPTVEEDKEMGYCLALLIGIDEPHFQETLRDLIGLIENTDEWDGPTVMEMGILANTLLLNETVVADKQYATAVARVVSLVVDRTNVYTVKGHRVRFDNENPENPEDTILVQITDNFYMMGDVYLVQDYDIDTRDDNRIVTTKPLQTAFQVTDGKHFWYIPLRYVEKFDECRYWDASHSASMKRYWEYAASFNDVLTD